MMYLQFSGGKGDALSRVVCTDHYLVASDDRGLRIYYDEPKSLWERVAEGYWLNCHVYSADRKLIFAYVAGDTDDCE